MAGTTFFGASRPATTGFGSGRSAEAPSDAAGAIAGDGAGRSAASGTTAAALVGTSTVARGGLTPGGPGEGLPGTAGAIAGAGTAGAEPSGAAAALLGAWGPIMAGFAFGGSVERPAGNAAATGRGDATGGCTGAITAAGEWSADAGAAIVDGCSAGAEPVTDGAAEPIEDASTGSTVGAPPSSGAGRISRKTPAPTTNRSRTRAAGRCALDDSNAVRRPEAGTASKDDAISPEPDCSTSSVGTATSCELSASKYVVAAQSLD